MCIHVCACTFLKKVLSLNLPFIVRRNWQACDPKGFSCVQLHITGVYSYMWPHLAFKRGSGEPNSGPQVCTANALLSLFKHVPLCFGDVKMSNKNGISLVFLLPQVLRMELGGHTCSQVCYIPRQFSNSCCRFYSAATGSCTCMCVCVISRDQASRILTL